MQLKSNHSGMYCVLYGYYLEHWRGGVIEERGRHVVSFRGGWLPWQSKSHRNRENIFISVPKNCKTKLACSM